MTSAEQTQTPLTRKERTILTLTKNGYSPRRIANILGITEAEVTIALGIIGTKAGVRNRRLLLCLLRCLEDRFLVLVCYDETTVEN